MRKIRKRIVSTALVSLLALSGIPYSMTAHAEETGTKTDVEAVTQDETEKENLEEVQSEPIGTLAVDETNFPDANFRSYLLKEYDPDGDGMIDPREVTWIDISGYLNIDPDGNYIDENNNYVDVTSLISSLKGIEYFPNLCRLDCFGNKLSSLDVSHNPELYWLECGMNNLTSLDVSQNSLLASLGCMGNNLTSLDVSHNPALYWLQCSGNNLTSLDVSHNPALEHLECGQGNLTNLDVRYNSLLDTLWCYDNNLTSLDVSQNPALWTLDCAGNNLTSLDVSQNPALEYLDCYENKLTNLDVSHNLALEELSCFNNNLTSLDVSQNSVLNWLLCENNSLTSLDVSKNPELAVFDCGHNNLTSLNLSNNTKLVTLGYDYDKVNGMDLSNFSSKDNFYLTIYFHELPKSGTLDLTDLGYQVEGLNMGAVNYELELDEYIEEYEWEYEKDFKGLTISTQILQGESSVPNVTGIYHLLQNRDGIVAGLCTEGLDKSEYEFSWYVCKDGKNWIMAQDWVAGNEWLSYRPDENGDYVLVGKARPIGGSDEDILTASSYFSYHHEICGKCQMPYEGEGGGYLIGFESYENPNQSYQYEMLVLDCTKLANGEDAWIYTTGKCGAGDGKALWTVWQPQYGYYWTLFRLYDADGNMLDEVCYGFQNI